MNNRLDKINAELQRVISKIIATQIKNPRVQGLISVTKVETTNDLKHAKVLISIYEDDAQKKQTTFAALESTKNFIRHELKSAIDLRIIPDLHFSMDNSLDNCYRVNELLSQINKEKE